MSKMLRLPEVMERTGLKRSTIYKWLNEKSFPQPVKLGARLIAWREAEIEEWIATRTSVAA